MERKTNTVDISTKSIIKFFLVILILLFLFLIKEVLAIFFISIVIAAAITPLVDKMHRRGIPRAIGVLVIFLVTLGVLLAIIALLIPPFTKELKAIADNFPVYYEKIIESFQNLQQVSAEHGLQSNIQSGLNNLTDTLSKFTSSLVGVFSTLFGSFFSLLGILVLTFYLTVGDGGAKKVIQSLAPVQYQPYLIQKIHQIEEKMGLWLRGQLILIIVIGIMTYVGLLLLGVEYAIVLAMFAGISEFVPYIGPIIGAVPAVLLAFTQSPTKALLVAILFVIIQQLENQLIVPKVMQKTVGLNPIIVLLVTLVGASIGGVAGLVLAVPAATIISIFIHDFFETKKEEENKIDSKEAE